MKRIAALATCLALLATVAVFAGGAKDAGSGPQAAGASKAVPTPGKAYWEGGGWNTVADYEKAAGKKIAKFNEAPMLAERVKAGKLPALDKRLPDPADVQVTDIVEEIGQYGGQWRQVWASNNEPWGQDRETYEGLMQYSWDGSKIVPNLAKKWEVSPDGKTFTFYLRKGLKWSDGQPYTVDDLIFTIEDLLGNKDITPTYPGWWQVNGKLPKLDKIDATTIRMTFDGPYGMFPQFVANSNWAGEPKHYLSKFHPKYAAGGAAALDKQAKDMGLTGWPALMQAKRNNAISTNPEYPMMRAWMLVSPPTAERTVFERNPYYWKVDPAGNQLPYIDTMVWDRAEDRNTFPLKAIAGELDLQDWGLGGNLAAYPLLKENEKKGGYRLLEYMMADGSRELIIPNYDTADPVLLDLFLDKRFRAALSLAINRAEINELVFNGMGKPYQAALMPGVPYYSEKWGKAYIEFDQAQANKLLDEAGLAKRNAEGWRLRPDGQVLDLLIECKTVPIDVKHLELVADHWKKVGLKATVKASARNLYTERDQAGVMTIKTWGNFDRQLPNFLVDAIRYVPISYNTETWRQWGLWYASGGKSGKEPPRQEFKEMMKLYDIARTTPSDAERDAAAKKIVEYWADNIYLIGTVSFTPFMRVVSNKMRNVPEKFQCDWAPRWDHSEQFFLKK
jgi:peptide/nickel transport system substrate-binding protein